MEGYPGARSQFDLLARHQSDNLTDSGMLTKAGERWNFESELALEKFVWANLGNLFNLTPLKQQYSCNGEVCDILAVDEKQQLSVLELKNTQDRYIVQQLTRYYDNIIDEKPFSLQINYSKPIHLVAITPVFHKHNFVDRKYNNLDIQFLKFDIIQVQGSFYLQLKNVDTHSILKIKIPYQEIKIVDLSQELLNPPKKLLEPLGEWESEEQHQILNLRKQILSFDKRMQEAVTVTSIKYGRGQGKLIAEFWFDNKQRSPILFLWLPLWRYRKPTIGRHRIWTTDWKTVSHIGHVTEGLGKRKPQSEWDKIPKDKHPRKLYSMHNFVADEFTSSIAASTGCKDGSNYLEVLVDLALEKWLSRL